MPQSSALVWPNGLGQGCLRATHYDPNINNDDDNNINIDLIYNIMLLILIIKINKLSKLTAATIMIVLLKNHDNIVYATA